MTARQFFAVVELRTKVISVSTYTLATLYAAARGVPVALGPALLLAVAVLCVDMGTTAFNSFFDYLRGVDSPLYTSEPDKVLVHERVPAAYALFISVGLYLVAAISGLAVAAVSSWWIVAAGVLSMIVGFLYTGGPLPISRTPLGELFAGGFLGTVLFLVVYAVHAGTVDAHALVASLPSTLVIAAVLTVNNTCDLDGDRHAGRRTLSIVIGRRAAVILIELLIAGAFGLVVWPAFSGYGASGVLGLGMLPGWAFAPGLLGAAASAVVLVRMHRRGYRAQTKHANMSAVVRVVVIYTLAYAALLAGAAQARV